MSQAEVDDVVPAGGSFSVSTRVLGGVITHQLRRASRQALSARDVIEYRHGFLRSLASPLDDEREKWEKERQGK